jgi:hypothetical protein
MRKIETPGFQRLAYTTDYGTQPGGVGPGKRDKKSLDRILFGPGADSAGSSKRKTIRMWKKKKKKSPDQLDQAVEGML